MPTRRLPVPRPSFDASASEDEEEEEDDEDEDEIIYATDVGTELVGTTEEVLDSGFVIDEGQEDLMNNVFGEVDSADADAYED